jgi:hypothetical protein
MSATLFVQPLDLVKNRMQMSGKHCNIFCAQEYMHTTSGLFVLLNSMYMYMFNVCIHAQCV